MGRERNGCNNRGSNVIFIEFTLPNHDGLFLDQEIRSDSFRTEEGSYLRRGLLFSLSNNTQVSNGGLAPVKLEGLF